nr:PEPxxWA-CTERM sorting domain-containing protein [Croceibacterium ferulae]
MPAVPEPASWAMLLAGFGAVGSIMRKRRVNTIVSYA